MTKLIRVRPEISATRDGLPSSVPKISRSDVAGEAVSVSKPARVRHTGRHGRHARTSDGRPSQRPPLSIRSAEGRRWSADLSGPGPAGLVIYGLGGIGKSTLATQIATRVHRQQAGHATGQVISVISGEVSAASLAAEPAETDFVILDDFDDNLSREAGQWCVRDPALAALLANWTGKLLITCRRPFALTGPPDGPPRPVSHRIMFRRLGPLTRSGAAELTASLPALRPLGDAERDHLWRLTAGHPLAVEYLDSLLAMGERFTDVAGRIEAMIQARTGQPLPGTEPTELPEAAAETIARAASELMVGELFDRLSAGARTLLLRASVFRRPVPADVLAGQTGHIVECEHAGLLVAGPGSELSVHRWTADELHRRLTDAGLGGQVRAAHRRAAGYWRPLAAASPTGHRAELEGRYHQRCAGGADEPEPAAEPESGGHGGRRRAVRVGVAGAVAVMAAVLAVEAAQSSSVPRVASADVAAQTSAPAPVSQAAAARDQAARWIARQVSRGAVMACDPAMCAALVQHGVPAGNLLMLGSGAADPLGSDVVVATAAVRGIFGGRLTSVYAPEVLASFGTGPARIDIRAVASDGAAAYLGALAADVRARQVAGHQLAGDPRIGLTPSARSQLTAGQVDARLLMTLAALAAAEPVRITAFTDDGPGASPGLPLRTVELVTSHAAASNMLAFFRAQRPPYLPAQAAIEPGPGGQSVLTVQFAAPSPLGLLQAPSAPR